MDIWKYFDLTHKFHTMMNPISDQKIDKLIDLVNLAPSSRVIDIGCGKGEFLIRLARKVNITAIGIDKSPYTIVAARERTAKMDLTDQIEYIESDGKIFLDSVNEKFDLSVCMGASWVFGGHEGTLRALSEITRKDGIVIVGEPYLIKQATQWYLDISEIKSEEFGTHSENIEIGENLGLRPMYSIVSNSDDWDQYEHLQWLGADYHLQNNPDDLDNDELMSKVTKNRQAYTREGRDVFGWALYIFRNLN